MTAPALTALEVAAGLVLDPRRRPRPLPAAGPPQHPRLALEAVVRRALEHGPCVVSFSGGRDSSLVLAVATSVARREGLPLPVPVTNRFRAAPRAHEAAWQEAVVRHLRLDDWVRRTFDAELDVVGPVAQRGLRRHGLLWPCNAHFHVPILEQARGGTVLTGIGGDEALSGADRGQAIDVLAGRAAPVPRDVLRVAYALAPPVLRAPVAGRGVVVSFPWLRTRAQRRVRRALAREAATQPLRWGRSFGWLHASRGLAIGTAALELLAADAGAQVLHPLLTPPVLAALASLEPAQRFRGRTAALTMLAGDLLPERLLARTSKAGFDSVFAADHARAFAARWRGAGVDAGLVDAEALRRTWLAEAPDPRSLTALQAAWLAAGAQPAIAESSAAAASSIDDQLRGRQSSQAGSAA